MSPDPPFVKGFNNPKYRDQVIKATRDAIDACAEYRLQERDLLHRHAARTSPTTSARRTASRASSRSSATPRRRGVTLCLEMLNTRATTHPMKGHPGYQGDHTDYCIDIIKRVGSPSLKLLFDIYHVQIMDGDVIRRHPPAQGRTSATSTPPATPAAASSTTTQEINYTPIMEALVEVGYQGYVGQEFIPTRDPLEGLRQAVSLCDV